MPVNQYIDKNGWVAGIPWCPSPNFDLRPPDRLVDLLILHNISLPPGEYGGPYIEDLFLNRLDREVHPFFQEIFECQVSAHFLIRRNGGITQFVSVFDRAWHAGQSEWLGLSNCNDYSIGIELEGSDYQTFTAIQYLKLAELTRLLLSFYPTITLDRIVGHSDVAPQRKTDPGPCFDWVRFKEEVLSAPLSIAGK